MNNRWPLFVDLYELTMAQAYFFEHLDDEAVFSTFVRKLPKNRNFLIACGLVDVLNFLENFKFSSDEIDFLKSLGLFKDEFLDFLKELQFTGDVYGLREGTVFFENEPILEIKAPIIQCQLLETYILNQIQFQTMIASKGVRICSVSQDRNVVDFGSRRAHGLDAGLKAARAFYISGMSATSNVLAGKIYNIPVTGTMAHSYIQVHSTEFDAFEAFSSLYPNTVLLIDTYDVYQGIENVIKLSKKLGDKFFITGIRIDSGDIITTSKEIRKILDRAGLYKVKIIVSGSLDEYKIYEIVKENAPIDGFGVGTKAIVSEDAPYLDIVYKLTEYKGEGKFKKSKGKSTIPFQKQVYRFISEGRYSEDIISMYKEILPGNPLIIKLMEDGKIVKGAVEDLNTIRERVKKELSMLPDDLKKIEKSEMVYPVKFSPSLEKIKTTLKENHG
ncbi:nicotinate phosphoribosyltransferase [Desulfothermus naphthae]